MMTEVRDPTTEVPDGEHAGASLDGPMPPVNIQGSLDMVHAGGITGWLANSFDYGSPRVVEILSNGELVGRVAADMYRADLKAAGIGEGKHAFRFNLPLQVFDGIEYLLAARDLETGALLPGSPKLFKALPAERGSLVLDGASLAGWARIHSPQLDQDNRLALQVLEEGEVIASCYTTLKANSPDTIEFRIPLPNAIFDGRPHLFSVRTSTGNIILGELATITPYQLTSEDALRQHARDGLTSALATIARFRYASLVGAMRGMVEQEHHNRDIQLAQLLNVHSVLVRGPHEEDTDFVPLVFPEVVNPRISIIIPAHNKFHVTYHCLASLLLASNKTKFEIIVVDDGSSDTTTQAPELLRGIRYVRNDEALGFIHACNRGARVAQGEYILMLNNDTEVTSGWLDEMLWPFEHFDGVGMVGAKLLYPDGRLQEAGGIVWNTGDPWNYGRLGNPYDPRYNYARQTDYLSGACIMLPRSLWNEVGGFSEDYVPAYFEDTDLAFQVRDLGYKTVYTPFAEVVHFEGVSNGNNVASGIKRFQEVNRPKFKKRWISACRRNGKLGTEVELNKDRNVEFRALILDAETPMPDKNAGAYAAIQEIRMLQALGFKCTFVPHNMAWMAHYTRHLQRMGVECLYSPYAASIGEILEKRGREFDLVYITRYYVAQHYIELIRKHAPQARIIMNNADLHFLRELRAAMESSNEEAMEQAVSTRQTELATMRQVDLVLSYTDVERAVIMSHNLDASKTAKCPWVAELPAMVPGFEDRADIAFLGGFNHLPNAEAVEWFVAKVMPLLRIALPGVAFRVYGSNVPRLLLGQLKDEPDVFVEGWVPTVDQVYNSSRVFVAPLQSGAGIKGKAIGALAHGIPCVLSPIAAEGIPVGDGSDALIADKPEEWVSAIVSLYDNALAWRAMSGNAKAFAERHYGFAKGVEQMRDALQQVDIFTSPDANSLFVR